MDFHRFSECLHKFFEWWNYSFVVPSDVVIALGTSVIVILTIVFAKRFNVRSIDVQEKQLYSTLDSTYFEIQKLVIENPHLAQPHSTGKTRDQIVQYEAFAFNVWNFIEAIHDYGQDSPELLKTWECIIWCEAKLHSEWFRNPENHNRKFKRAFYEFVKTNELVEGLPVYKGDRKALKLLNPKQRLLI